MIVHSDPLSAVHVADCLSAEAAIEAMAGQRADALIFDAPFSAKTHEGHKNGKLTTERAASFARAQRARGLDSAEIRYASKSGDAAMRRDIVYPHFDGPKIDLFCRVWLPLCAGWVVSITDDVLAPEWASAFEQAGLYVFAPLPLVELGGRIRVCGDGPSSWTCWIVVARPRGAPYSKWGTLPGAYVQSAERDFNRRGGSDRIVGGKPFKAMCAIVGDYSRRGDLIVDPFCGGGTTLAAAKHMGRRSIGLDRSELHAKISAKRVSKTREQMSLFEASPERVTFKQEGLFK
jgi:site-specific DNA-methyltransferase (adenine-specific)